MITTALALDSRQSFEARERAAMTACYSVRLDTHEGGLERDVECGLQS